MMKITYLRDVKTPERSHDDDAGLDLFVPELNGEWLSRFQEFEVNTNGNTAISVSGFLRVRPHSTVVIPSGIAVDIPYGYVGMICNRGSVPAKKRLIFGSHIVDCGYNGEVFINLQNLSNESVDIYEHEKIVQLLVLPVTLPELEEVNSIDQFDNGQSERGEGGFGSTDK